MKTGDDGNGGPNAGTLTSENTVILKKIQEFLDWIALSIQGNHPDEACIQCTINNTFSLPECVF